MDPVTTTITVDHAAAGRPVSPDLWGIFFEDVNYAADGGLYGELVQNRSFGYSARDRADWDSLTGWTVRGDVTMAAADPLGPRSPRYAVLGDAGAARGASAALVNDGFDGISLTQGSTYRLSVFARAQSPGAQSPGAQSPGAQSPGTQSPGAAAVRVELTGTDGVVLAQTRLEPVSDRWTCYERFLTVSGSCAAGRLALTVDAPASVAIGFVSLFPADTFGNQRNGLRSDLAETIARLRPRFVRFPGGCVAHGLGLDNLYRWKDTIGAPHERRQNFNIWGYHQSMGLGYFEYFVFCEQIGARPLPVLAAGVCCQNTEGGPRPVPDDEMDGYIADVLDLIEFANGPAATPWGARRAQLGHPAPFGLEFLAIGNEDKQNAVFRNRFERIYRAVRGKHPELTLIGTAGPSPFGQDYELGWRFARELDVDVVDEHSYKAPKWFFENLDRYDGYDRGGPAVYVGEYGSWGNSMLNALAEAAYMMAMERNGDIVRLASYAPLLAKAGHTQWVPDLIYFDNERVMPTLNYYVQQMHAAARGDRSLPVTVAGAPVFRRAPQGEASVAVRAADADVTVTGLRLNGSEPLSAAFSGRNGEARFPVATRDEDYTLTLQVSQASGAEGFTVAFGALDSPDYFEWHFGTWKNRFRALYYRADGYLDEYTEPVPFAVEAGRVYDLEVRVTGRGRHITCLLDGEVVHQVVGEDRPEQRFSATAVRDSATGTVHVKIVNATDRTVRAELEAGPVNPAAAAAVLAAAPEAGSAFEPAPAAPVHTELDLAEPVTLQPYSFTVVSLRAAGDTAVPEDSQVAAVPGALRPPPSPTASSREPDISPFIKSLPGIDSRTRPATG